MLDFPLMLGENLSFVDTIFPQSKLSDSSGIYAAQSLWQENCKALNVIELTAVGLLPPQRELISFKSKVVLLASSFVACCILCLWRREIQHNIN